MFRATAFTLSGAVIPALALSILPASAGAAFDLDRMEVRAPQPPANHIEAVAFVNGRWVIGDAKGTISNSEDGETWATVTTPYDNPIEDIGYYNGLYMVAGADRTTLLLSNDLVNWELTRPRNFPGNPNEFVEAFGFLYVVGGSIGLSRTQDLVDWESVDTGGVDRTEGVAFNGTTMAIAGQNGEIITSEDGTTWTLRQSEIPGAEGLAADLISMSWAGGQFLAGGKDGSLMSSPDGVAWTLVDFPSNAWIYTVVEVEGALITPGENNGEIHRTQNLVDWETIDTGLNDSIQDIEYNGELVMAVGRDGAIAVSTNGTEWESPLDENLRANMRHLAFHDGTYVATASNSVVTISNDTEAWVPVFEIPEERQSAGMERFLDAFTIITNRGLAYTSPDGQTWTEVTGPGGNPNRIRVIDDRLWVVGRNGEISWTTDLVSWTTATAGTADLRDITKGPEGFAAAGRSGELFWSTDGASWNPVPIDETRNFITLFYFSGNYFAFGFPGFHWKSSDGAQWSLVDTAPQPFNVQDYVITDGTVVLPGYLGQVDVSTDGETWERFRLPTSHTLGDLLITPDRTVVVGGQGSILSSPSDVGPGFAAWQELRFNVLQRLDPGISGPEADPDKDKRANLLEYFSNSQPLIPDDGSPVVLTIEENGGTRYPVFSYPRSVSAIDVLAEVKVSMDGEAWLPASTPESPLGGVEETVEPLDTETDSVSLRFTTGLESAGSALVRLQLSLGEEP